MFDMVFSFSFRLRRTAAFFFLPPQAGNEFFVTSKIRRNILEHNKKTLSFRR
jgi:hypothetical protein